MRKIVFFGFIALGVTLAATGGAFPFVSSWHSPADGNDNPNADTPQGRAGAGDIYGTGAAQDWGILCSHCHIDSAGAIGARIDVSPAWGTQNGESTYTPGVEYTITVNMLGEHLGLNNTDTNGNPVPNDNLNSVNVVIEDANGQTAGVYKSDRGEVSTSCPPNPPATNVEAETGTTIIYGDCHGVLSTQQKQLTAWTFNWIAPAAGAGDVTLYYGMVDGDHGGNSSLDDDVKEGTLRLLEGN